MANAPDTPLTLSLSLSASLASKLDDAEAWGPGSPAAASSVALSPRSALSPHGEEEAEEEEAEDEGAGGGGSVE